MGRAQGMGKRFCVAFEKGLLVLSIEGLDEDIGRACWTTRSFTVGMPSGRLLPSAFGISTLSTGSGS